MQITVTFHGGTGMVTGSNFLLESGNAKILIDCGMVQGGSFCEKGNCDAFPYDPASVAVLLVTHAHIDHVGRIPKLVKEGFKGIIYSTEATKELAAELLADAVSVMREEEARGKGMVLYDESDVAASLSLWKTRPYHAEQELPGELSFSFLVSGHILGSALVRFTPKEKGKSLLFTGDLGNPENPLLPPAEIPKGISYLVMESVYGNRTHEKREERMDALERIVRETTRRGGVLLIPAFAAERTQDLLFELHELMRKNRIPHVPFFVDSPLATRITKIYRSYPELYSPPLRARAEAGEQLFAFPGLTFTETREESAKIATVRGPKIIIAGSGMSHGGRVLSHEAMYLPDPTTTFLIVGYQSAGSLGRRIAEGMKEVEISGKKVRVRASVEKLLSYSAHMDSDALLSYAEGLGRRLEKTFVVMGEPAASLFLTQRLNGSGIKASAPVAGEKVTIEL